MDFDKFFEPVDDKEPLLVVVVSNVAGTEPPVWRDGFTRGFRIVDVAFHHLDRAFIGISSMHFFIPSCA